MQSNQVLLIVVIMATLANLSLGVIALSRNPRGLINRFFFINTLALAGWSITNYLVESLVDPRQLFISQMLVLTFVLIQNAAFFISIRYFSGDKLSRLVKFVYLPFTALVLLMPLAGSIYASYGVDNDGYFFKPGPALLLNPIHVLITIIWGFVYFAKRYRQTKSQQRNQFRYLMLAGLVLWVAVPLSQQIIPRLLGEVGQNSNALVGGWRLLIVSAPLYALLFASVIAFAIIRQRLFDIRPFVARTVSFLILAGLLTVTYLATASFAPKGR